MKFLVLGLSGQDGQILEVLAEKHSIEIFGISHKKTKAKSNSFFWDGSSSALREILHKIMPDVVVNFSAVHSSSLKSDDSNFNDMYKTNTFNVLTILLGLGSMFFAFTYPYMKRITYWPQLFLGITFNYGLVLGFIAIENQLSLVSITFYIGAIFWTLGYDTIYGFQDIKDDEIIGVKSTSIKFKNNPKKFLSISYIIFILSLIIVGILMDFKNIYFLFMIFPIYHLLNYQINKLNTTNPDDCFNKFKSNNFLGLLVLLNILIGKII